MSALETREEIDAKCTCEWCGAGVSLADAEAVRPPGGAITMCVHCAPCNPDWEV